MEMENSERVITSTREFFHGCLDNQQSWASRAMCSKGAEGTAVGRGPGEERRTTSFMYNKTCRQLFGHSVSFSVIMTEGYFTLL